MSPPFFFSVENYLPESLGDSTTSETNLQFWWLLFFPCHWLCLCFPWCRFFQAHLRDRPCAERITPWFLIERVQNQIRYYIWGQRYSWRCQNGEEKLLKLTITNFYIMVICVKNAHQQIEEGSFSVAFSTSCPGPLLSIPALLTE